MDKSKQLIIAVGVLAVLVSVTLFMRRDPFEKLPKPDYASLLPSRTEGSIDRMMVKNKTGSITVEKRGDKWLITEPQELPAEESIMKEVASSMERLAIVDLASENKERQAEYGVAKESPDRIEVKAFSKGNEVLAFFGGGITPGSTGSFIVIPSAPDKVYSTGEPLPFVLSHGIKDWRNRSIVQIPGDDIERLQLTNAKGTLDVEKDAQNQWHKKDDPTWQADPDRLIQLTSLLSKLLWADVIDTPDPATDTGFQFPWAKITVTAKGKDTVILVGKELEAPKGNTWVKVEGDSKLYQIRKPQSERFAREPDFYKGEPAEKAAPEKPDNGTAAPKPEQPMQAPR